LENKQYLYSQSHQNDPLGALIANEVIDTITDENLLERSERIGNLIVRRLNLLKNTFSSIKAVRGRGLMIAIELTERAELFRKELLNRGYILVKRSGVEVLRMDPALTIKEQDIESFLDTFEKILHKIDN